jgi:ssDNA-binding Zn-finger/Zn-ribbon topoisomerase 1
MESLGIGRPSTYAKTMETLKERAYVNIIDKKFHPTEIGIETTDKLQEFFKDIINVKYTKEMEDDLDKIADGDLIWYNLLNRFYNDFEPKVTEAFKNMEKTAPIETGEICPNCTSPLVIKQSKYGKFTACSNYPECKYIKQNEETKKEVVEIIYRYPYTQHITNIKITYNPKRKRYNEELVFSELYKLFYAVCYKRKTDECIYPHNVVLIYYRIGAKRIHRCKSKNGKPVLNA